MSWFRVHAEATTHLGGCGRECVTDDVAEVSVRVMSLLRAVPSTRVTIECAKRFRAIVWCAEPASSDMYFASWDVGALTPVRYTESQLVEWICSTTILLREAVRRFAAAEARIAHDAAAGFA